MDNAAAAILRKKPKRRSMALDLPVKVFPVTMPLLGPEAAMFFRPPPKEALSDPAWPTPHYPVRYSISRLDEMSQLIDDPALPGHDWFALAARAEELTKATAGVDELIAPRHLADVWRKAGVIPYPHQLETARKVLFDMDGKAILADEVGLGKTIEAGLIIKELLLRELAHKALILTPAALLWQWHRELKEKFNIVCGMQRSEYDWERVNVLVASLDTAKRSPHREIIQSLDYDILVVDEAHKLKNERTQNYQFVNGIRRKYSLLLTATPVQNDLRELYTLITLLRPGQLGTYRQFKLDFVEDPRTPKRPEMLRSLLSGVLVRNRREEGAVSLPPRRVHALPVNLSSDERTLYDGVSRFVQEGYRRALGKVGTVLPLITLQREVCSSPIAAAITLEKMIRRTPDPVERERMEPLMALAAQFEDCAKARRLEELIRGLDEKVIVFTEYRATQDFLRWRLQKAGFSTLAFNGSLSASRKEWIRELFRRQAQVLVSTESGGEGLNFQFCRSVVNYDLPWNPMRIEQRIGRVHRLGQTQEVQIYNLATRATIEEHILFLLYEKINMFQMVLGELDAILSHIKLNSSFERELTDILVGSQSQDEARQRLNELAESMLNARQAAQDGPTIDALLQ